jgi:predicted nucleotide-binding protein
LMLERPEAALALAADLGINISRWATREQRQQIGQARAGVPPSTVVAQSSEPIPREDSGRRPKREMPRPLRGPVASKRRGKTVFVVVGRNAKINRAMFQFVRSLNLQPIEWSKAVALTGKPNPYIGEVLVKAFDKASAVLVLMTPDDEARLKKEFRTNNDEEFEKDLCGQPRPNVLFEAGFALSKYENNTVLVAVGKLRPFSDIHGRHVLRMDGTPERRTELARRLQSTGLDVDKDGIDWLTEGDFSL